MSSYRALCHLQFFHTYYADLKLRKMEIVPMPTTQEFIHKTGLFPKFFDNGCWLVADTALIAYWQKKLTKENIVLSFALQPTNPYWLAMTAAPTLAANPLDKEQQTFCYFANQAPNENYASATVATETLPFETNLQTAQLIDYQLLDKEVLTTDEKYFLQNLKFYRLGTSFVQLFLNQLVAIPTSQNFSSYHIHFQAKVAYWQYIVVPKYSKGTDLQLGVESATPPLFADPVRVQHEQLGEVFQINSLQPLIVAEVSPYHFQLKKYGRDRAKASKTVIERMPVASLQQLQADKAVIYVYI